MRFLSFVWAIPLIYNLWNPRPCQPFAPLIAEAKTEKFSEEMCGDYRQYTLQVWALHIVLKMLISFACVNWAFLIECFVMRIYEKGRNSSLFGAP